MPVSRERIRRELQIFAVASVGGDKLSKSVHGDQTQMPSNQERAATLRHHLALRTNEQCAETELELLNAVAGLEAENSALSTRLAALTLERDEAQDQLNQICHTSSQERKEIERLEAALAELTSKVEAKHVDVSADVEKLGTALADANAFLLTKDSEFEDLRSMLKISGEEVCRLAMQDVAKQEEIVKFNEMTKIITNEKDTLVAEVKELRHVRDADKQRIKELEAHLDKANADNDAAQKLSTLQQENALLEMQLKESDTSNDTLKHEMQVVQSVLASTEKQNDDLQHQLGLLKDQQRQSERSTHEQIRRHVARAVNNHEIEELRRELKGANMREGELEMELHNQRNIIKTLEKEKFAIATELEHHLEEIITGNAQLKARLQAKDDEVTVLRGDMTALRQEMDEYVAIKRQEIDDAESELIRKSRIIAEKDRTIQSFRDLSNEYLKSAGSHITAMHSPRAVHDPMAIISP